MPTIFFDHINPIIEIIKRYIAPYLFQCLQKELMLMIDKSMANKTIAHLFYFVNT